MRVSQRHLTGDRVNQSNVYHTAAQETVVEQVCVMQ